ncbi:lysostaphin resistance A-like protein [Amycolatopsis azurea]|uniref:CPBP family intramembrane glutamic endopeptidase n=1 Tax=Amycolatopsis azurea TaxID=36819 RepID=UPI0037F6919E
MVTIAPIRHSRRLRDLWWCLLVSLGVLTACFVVGAGAVAVAGEPVLGTVILDGMAIVCFAVSRLAGRWWLTGSTTSRSHRWSPQNMSMLVGCTVLAFLAGQSMALWLYGSVGSAAFEESVHTRREAGATTVLLTVVMAPLAEEMIFRGLLYPVLRTRVSVAAAAGVTATVFGLLHGNLVQFIFTTPLSVLLSLVYEHTRTIWAGVVLHLAANLAASLIPLSGLAVLARPEPALLLTAMFATCLLIYSRHVRDTSVPVEESGRRPRLTRRHEPATGTTSSSLCRSRSADQGTARELRAPGDRSG